MERSATPVWERSGVQDDGYDMAGKIFLIAMGGALGSIARYAVSGAAQRWTGSAFPVGTLTVNLVGCYLIGLLATMFSGPIFIRDEFRLALLIGVLGGFTTFSSFGWETLSLIQDRQWIAAMINIVASNVVGLAAVWAGFATARRVYGV